MNVAHVSMNHNHALARELQATRVSSIAIRPRKVLFFGGARGDWLTRSAKFPRGLNGGFTLVNWLRRVANQKIRTPALILGGSPCKQNQPIYADQDPAGWPLQAVRVIRVK
jgi:hypothetical protein